MPKLQFRLDHVGSEYFISLYDISKPEHLTEHLRQVVSLLEKRQDRIYLVEAELARQFGDDKDTIFSIQSFFQLLSMWAIVIQSGYVTKEIWTVSCGRHIRITVRPPTSGTIVATLRYD